PLEEVLLFVCELREAILKRKLGPRLRGGDQFDVFHAGVTISEPPCHRTSMKIPRRGGERAEERAVVEEAPGHEVHDLAVALDDALYAKKPSAEELGALGLHQPAPDDDVHAARLVLERDEHPAARRIGPLAA